MKCPGQDMKYWKASAIFDTPCPKCNTNVEFYKDDTSRKCSNCGHRFVNPKMDFGCASYCPYAEQCIGALPEEFTGGQENLLKDKVAVEMKRFFQADFKRIRQATTTARFVENIGKAEGGNLAILLCAAYLHDTGPAATTTILNKVGFSAQIIDEIGVLLNRSKNFNECSSLQERILHDALALRQWQDDLKESLAMDGSRTPPIEPDLFTDTAQAIAASLTN